MSRSARVPMTALLLAAGLVASASTASLQTPRANDAVRGGYRMAEDYFQPPPGRALGWVMGISLDKDGRSVWLFDKCGGETCDGSTLAPILKFDASGKFVKGIGAGLVAHPHGLHVDRDGNVWAIDGFRPPNHPAAPNRGHQVFKL